MATLNQIHLPDALLADIQRRAQARGVTVEQQLVMELSTTRGAAPNADDEALLAEIRVEREAMAANGIQLTDEILTKAKKWGRE